MSPREGRGRAAWRSPDAAAVSRRLPDTGPKEVAREGPARQSPVCSFPEVEATTQSASARQSPRSKYYAAHGGSSPSPTPAWHLRPAPPVQWSEARCIAAVGNLQLPVSAKKTKQPQATRYPDEAAPPPKLGRACGDRDGGRGAG